MGAQPEGARLAASGAALSDGIAVPGAFGAGDGRRQRSGWTDSDDESASSQEGGVLWSAADAGAERSGSSPASSGASPGGAASGGSFGGVGRRRQRFGDEWGGGDASR